MAGIAALGLSACGSDGGGFDGSKQRVVEELGQLGKILYVRGPLLGDATTPFIPGPSPDALLPEACDQGIGSVDSGEATRSYAFYDIEPVVEFKRYDFEACRVDGEIGDAPARLDYDGQAEIGVNNDYDPANLADSYDRYAEFGVGDEPFVSERTIRDADTQAVVDQAVERFEGVVEWREFDNGTDFASTLTYALEQTIPDAYSLIWLQGETDDPLRINTSPGMNFITAQGPYTYNSSRCVGGARRVALDITRDNAGYPVAGDIAIEIGATTITIGFAEDGGATASFGDGETVTLTAEEVRAAIDEPAC